MCKSKLLYQKQEPLRLEEWWILLLMYDSPDSPAGSQLTKLFYYLTLDWTSFSQSVFARQSKSASGYHATMGCLVFFSWKQSHISLSAFLFGCQGVKSNNAHSMHTTISMYYFSTLQSIKLDQLPYTRCTALQPLILYWQQ